MKKGFSLAEVIWGVLILSIIIVTVTGIFTGILVSSKKSNKFVVATGLAEKQIEYIKLMGGGDIPVDTSYDGAVQQGDLIHDDVYFPPYPLQPAFLKETVDGITYYYKIDTAFVPDTGDRLMSITVQVYWEESDYEGKGSVTFELYKTL